MRAFRARNPTSSGVLCRYGPYGEERVSRARPRRLEESKVRKAIRVTTAEYDVSEVPARRLLPQFFRAGLSPDLPSID